MLKNITRHEHEALTVTMRMQAVRYYFTPQCVPTTNNQLLHQNRPYHYTVDTSQIVRVSSMTHALGEKTDAAEAQVLRPQIVGSALYYFCNTRVICNKLRQC